jgi:hypothetical protein
MKTALVPFQFDGRDAMWCQCCIVTGPLGDFIRPDNSEDWTRLVLDEVDRASALRALSRERDRLEPGK